MFECFYNAVGSIANLPQPLIHELRLNNEFSLTDLITPLSAAFVAGVVGIVSTVASVSASRAAINATRVATQMAHWERKVDDLTEATVSMMELSLRPATQRTVAELEQARLRLELLVDTSSENGRALADQLELVHQNYDLTEWRREFLGRSRAVLADVRSSSSLDR